MVNRNFCVICLLNPVKPPPYLSDIRRSKSPIEWEMWKDIALKGEVY
jgi:hypothetical protein